MISMPKHIDFDNFIEAMRSATAPPDLVAIMTEWTHLVGFEQFAMGHHVDLLRPPSDAVRVTNYSADWIEQSVEKRLFLIDPVHQVSARADRPFQWREIHHLILMTDEQRDILERAKPFGLVEGYTVPVNLPGEYQGSCSFAARDLDRLHPYALPLSQYITSYGFECARRLMRLRDGKGPEPAPHITPKQRDAIILVGRGKTDAEIGIILGISQATAHDHVEAGRRAYGNAPRPHMVLRAVFDGLFTFADVFRR
jgi:LuxR family quorum-sensing system transcriptional regulator CciR